MIYSVQTRIRR